MQEETGNHRIRLALVNDHHLSRASLARLLAAENDFEVAGDCGSAAEASDLLRASAVDLVLLDFDLGNGHGEDSISVTRNGGYRGRFLIVTDSTDAGRAAQALKLGASGIFLKSDAPERLIQAIRLIATGAVWVDQKVIQRLADKCLDAPQRFEPRPLITLDHREQETLVGILSGLTNRDIAARLGTSESAVKNLLQGLFSRTGVRKRSQLVRLALEGAFGELPETVKASGT